MACYLALASLVELLEDILQHHRYPKFPLGEQHILKPLLEKFSSLQALWQGLGHPPKPNPAADLVESRIRDAACRAQDIIEFEMSNQIASVEKTDVIASIFHQLISICQKPLRPQLRAEYREDLRKVEEEVDSIVKELTATKERQTIEVFQQSYHSTGADAFPPPSIGRRNIMVGFDNLYLQLLDRLTGQASKLEVIPIVGMGGQGKTTLARAVYDHPLLVQHFDLRIWVKVSQIHDLYSFTQNILKSMGIVVNEMLAERAERIYKQLYGRRYLIVIDDIWSIEVWDDIRRYFPNDMNGSRIVLTTRLSEVAQDASTSHSFFKISFLNKDDSWKLFVQYVFGEESCPPELEDVGKLIIRKCAGLPLAICTVANILSKVGMIPEYWEMIATEVESILSKDENSSSTLSLTYNVMPHHLKACLLYMASFPANYEINISKLTKLWIAEGFLKSVDGSKTLKQVAENCLKYLVRGNIVLVTKKEWKGGNFKTCSLHNIWRIFCREKASPEAVHGNGSLHPTGVKNARRIILDETSPYEPHPSNTGKLADSSLWFSKICSLNLDTVVLDSLKLSRVLLGIQATITWPIPNAIFQMFHLKYLELYLECLRPGVCLPASICALQNLQTLIISGPRVYSIRVPPEIWKMTRLQHLIIGAMALPPLPPSSQKLENLETLMTVENFIFSKDAIQLISNLQKLKLSCMGFEGGNSTWELYCLNNLIQLHRLEELKISVYAAVFPCVDSVWTSFVLPLNLRKLSLEGCSFSWEETSLVGSLPKLEVLKLRNNSFTGEGWEPTRGEFCNLKFLLLEELDLKYLRADVTHFPHLEHLKINKCSELLEIPSGIGYIRTLRFLDVYTSIKSAADSAIRIKVRQHQLGNKLQVRVRIE